VTEDLARRDFTVNAISLPLQSSRRGELVAAEQALDDLDAGRLRILHGRSFIDDPTRLLRLARYAARLGFEVERRTAQLAREAIAGGALRTVSGARIAAELWLVTEEPTDEAFTIMGRLGALAALGLPARYDAQLRREACGLLPGDGSPGLVSMAVLFHDSARGDDPGARAAAGALMQELEFVAGTREQVLASAYGVDSLAAALEGALSNSQLARLLAGRPLEAVAIAGALAGRRSPSGAQAARRWLQQLRHVKPRIGGDELVAAGVAQGPEIGRRLQWVQDRLLDGELGDSSEEQLRAALDGPS
jgi:tRNA nucleotidyltransferase (CCA-adding enzyme)